MELLAISRRTLQRWIDDMDIEPLEFEDHLRVFLTLPNIECLREYKKFMRTRDNVLISGYRESVKSGDPKGIARARKGLTERTNRA